MMFMNWFRTSHSDSRAHITLRMKTSEQVEKKSGQIIHIYYNKSTGDHEAFTLYSEREDKADKDEPTEE